MMVAKLLHPQIFAQPNDPNGDKIPK
jgi:hypothetical protein